MNGMTNPIIFYPVALFLIFFAISTIVAKNIFKSLLSAILVFYITGIIFYMLNSEYNAIIQIAIYGIAVPIILGIAIMFTNPKEQKDLNNQKSIFKYAMFLISGIFVLALTYLVLISLTVMPTGFNIAENLGIYGTGTITAFGKGIYNKYVFAFEIISLILTIVVVGLTLFNKGDKNEWN